MKIIESGIFQEKYHYIKIQVNSSASGENLVLFPPTMELIFPIHKNPKIQFNQYKILLPKTGIKNVYVIGYNPNLSVETFGYETAKNMGTFVKEKIGPCIIAGISYGGIIAIPFAHFFPELTRKLLLIVTSYAMSNEGIKLSQKMVQLAKNKSLLRVQLTTNHLYKRRIFRWIMKLMTIVRWPFIRKNMNPPSTLINAYTHNIKYNFHLEPYIHNITCQTLIIGGTADQFFSEQNYNELASNIKESQLILFPDETHVVPVEKLKKVKAILNRFINSQ